MSFFPIPDKKSKKQLTTSDVQMLHTLECQACPLADIKSNAHPNMPASGSKKPIIYCLGEAPGREEDERNKQFVGQSGNLLRDILEDVIGKDYRDIVRWNNVVRTRPVDENGYNATPTIHAIECCRPSVVRDIEETKPAVIWGFGGIPLNWLLGTNGIFTYRGRKFPVRVGSHVCWYYPMLHPAAILHGEKNWDPDDEGDDDDRDRDQFANEDHRFLKFDIEHAYADLEAIEAPHIHSVEECQKGVEILTDCNEADLRKLAKAFEYYADRPRVGLDYETENLRPYRTDWRVLTCALSDAKRSTAWAFDHPGAAWSPKQRAKVGDMWKEFLREAKCIKAVHNLQFELEWTGHRFGEELIRAGKWECTQVQASIIDNRYRKISDPGPMSLGFLGLQYFGVNIKSIAGVDRGDLVNTPLPHVLMYNGVDAKYHHLLQQVQAKRILDMGLQVPYQLAIRRVATLVLAQLGGVPVSQKKVQELNEKYTKRALEAREAIKKDKTVKKFVHKYGHEFDPNKHCVKLFHEMEGYTECEVYDKKKKSVDMRLIKAYKPQLLGSRNIPKQIEVFDKDAPKNRKRINKIGCDEDVLTAIGGKLTVHILKCRKAEKLLSTYIHPMIQNGEGVVWADGLMHPIFNHTLTDTGRLSAEAPNIQNYPKRGEESKEVRKAIVARKGYMIVAIDYGQIEARVIAMYTKDKKFVKALWENYDIHGEWARRIAERIPKRIGGKQYLDDPKIMKKFRTDIKNQWTFPLCFGATLESICFYLSQPCDYIADGKCLVTADDLRDVHDEFWDEFNGIREWQETLRKSYEKCGYVETFTGRRRWGPMSFNKLINAPVQGFTAELVMDGMCRLSETGDPLLQPQIQIHDDITWVHVPENKVEYVIEKALDILLNPGDPFKKYINVPITMEAGVGKDWLSMEEVGIYSSHDWKAAA